jgi:hypothetical protein
MHKMQVMLFRIDISKLSHLLFVNVIKQFIVIKDFSETIRSEGTCTLSKSITLKLLKSLAVVTKVTHGCNIQGFSALMYIVWCQSRNPYVTF